MRRRPSPLLLLAVVAASACGSTVQDAAQPADGLGGTTVDNGQGTSGSSTTGTSPAGTTGVTTPGGTGGGTAGGGTQASTTRTGGGDTTSGSGALGSPDAQGIGITASKIYVGITYTINVDAAQRAIGANNLTSGNERADAQAVIDEINAHGGVAGRKLVPVWATYDAETTETRASQDQAACSTLTEDNKVFAVAGVGLTDTLPACLRKAGVLQVEGGVLISSDEQRFREYPQLFDITGLSQDRMMADQVRAWQRLGWFGGWDTTLGAPGKAKAKLGIVAYDDPNWRRPMTKVLLPALARAGHPVDPNDIAYIHVPASTAENGGSFNQISNAELRFRRDGVTHAIVLDAGGGLTLLFGKDANTQHYYPRLGLNTGAGMQGLYDAKEFDAKMLTGAMGLGWEPAIDLTAAKANAYATPATKRCYQVMKQRTGQTFDSTNAAAIALMFCDEINLIAAGAAGAGPTINLRTATAALERLGSGFPSATLATTFLGPGRHDALEIGYDMVWDSDCTCAAYRDKGHRIPS